MKLFLKIIALFFLLFNPSNSFAKNEYLTKYTVEIKEEKKQEAIIKAHLSAKDSTIRMASWGHPWLTNGWATFIQDLEIKTKEGKEISYQIIEKDGWGKWKVDAKDGTELILTYKVIFDHSKYDWNPAGGIDSRPEVTNDAHFLVSKALFIYSPDTKTSNVTFNLPNDWNIATNWKPIAKSTYFVDSWINLINNSLVVGNFIKKTASSGKMDLILAIDNRLKDHVPLFKDVLHKQLNEFDRIFKGTPDKNYLITIREADEDDGESFHDSFNQVITTNRINERLIVWGNTMAHEMFHYWNGGNFLVGEPLSDLYWFSEGFTEYYASRSLVRTGVINSDTYLRKLERYFSRYFVTKKMWTAPQISLVEAGKEKGENWLLLYGGGATIAFILDIEIRHHTNNAKSLDDVMLYLKINYGDKKIKITNDNILNAVNVVSNKDFSEFFNKYIYGTKEYLDISSTVSKAGLNLDSFSDEMYLSKKKGLKDSIFSKMIKTKSD